MTCQRCGGLITPDGYGDSRCSSCGRDPRVSYPAFEKLPCWKPTGDGYSSRNTRGYQKRASTHRGQPPPPLIGP